MSELYTALQVVMMPRDANPNAGVVAVPAGSGLLYNTIFGGVILSYIDQAGAIGAIREIVRAGGPPPTLVTVALRQVEFHHPVLVGDVVRFRTQLLRIGRTSITVHVAVEAERRGAVQHVTDAEVVYVGIDPASPERRPVPLLPGGAHSPTSSAEKG